MNMKWRTFLLTLSGLTLTTPVLAQNHNTQGGDDMMSDSGHNSKKKAKKHKAGKKKSSKTAHESHEGEHAH